ncbi:MAG: hemerythrin domain-containing protein [Candidatus Marinimicrobia bacterium]|nr:hemerythrin domain-containing protein [Candidatus Neomarinimicrobiota bacterium]MCF7903776.1 hemerythrin domain-containing protein [Candidatus Neomarinimicrobiota bacterium]
MSQPRMNIFNFTHKGLRLALSRLTVLSGKTDVTNEASLSALKNLTKEVVNLLDIHAHAEDSIILPALEEKAPGSTARILADHKTLDKSISVFASQVAAMTPNSPAAQSASVYTSLFNFFANYIIHMAMEEHDINRLIWEHFTDDEIMAWQGQIMAGFTPDQILSFYKYMIPALNPFEQKILLGGFKSNAPTDFFDSVMNMLEQQLSESEYSQLRSMLS